MTQRSEARLDSGAMRQIERWDIAPQASSIIALIPAYNEERFIGSLVLNVQQFVDQVVVVDDGSADQTAQIARRAGAMVLRHQANSGKAAAVNTGFNYLRQLGPAAVVMLDGDGQHCADDIPAVLEPVLAGHADIVVGSRFLDVKSDIPAYRQVGQHSLTLLTNLASGVPISDSQSGYRAFSAAALAALTFGHGGFSLESEMQFLANEHRLRIVEVPIKVVYAEPAKRNPVSHGMQVVNAVMRLVGQTRPLLFFGAPGFATLLAGVLLGLYVIRIYATSHQLAQGYALITVALSLVGLLLLFSAIILHSVRGMIVDLRQRLIERLADPYQRKVDYRALEEPYDDAGAAGGQLLKEREHAS
ncbi:MAG TPA: glycosyltransferase [Kouleothrix sp.]|uniref:glycosyltransferase n=1 Tax=Kouleothrix sp. TaxID=2779161 RepID=UPI002CF44DE3|nr:glycosyltransferase [Kouleothrix sp.]HRC77361.1 glycosyltransferase [Kouleothrix sp.]